GMLDVTKNPSQLAAVIGHEIAHVRARHSEERLSQALVADAGLTLADAFTPNSHAGQIAVAALGIGTQVGVLMPYSRAHELEADKLGLENMARAGFDPEESVELWRQMSEATGQQPPEFLSTH